jgi:hypothetical protein
MANEFKVKNGLIVDAGGAQITGGITGSTDFNTIVNKPTLISSSAQVTSVTQTVSGTNSAELVRGNMADNDQFRILVGGTASNAGYVEIATADDGTEPIYVRQYTGVFGVLVRTATLLDGSGNTTFPGTLSAPNIGWSTQQSSNGGEIQISQGQFKFDKNIRIDWGGTAGVNAIRDLGLRRNTTGSLEIYDGVNVDGAVANRRDLIARNITGSNAFFSGSSTITGSLGVSGSIIATNGITGSIAATNGVVSGSSQITAGSTTNFSTDVKTQLNTNTVVSGSSQVTLASTTGGGTAANVQFNSLGIGMVASATTGRIDASGDIIAFSTSDKNFKENITPIPNALEKISKISGNIYNWKSELKEFHGFEGNDVGVIAQEIEEVLPQLVTTRENGYKAVKYDKLVALLIEGIKEQQIQIEELKAQIGSK